MITTTDKIAAPSLPLAPENLNRQYQDQFSNVLRLYFNQLDTSINTQTNNITALQTEIDALSLESQRNQTLIWLNM
jgi:hypothetical protein